jgi:DNA-binding transcriptional regulator YdaS (Cro superfamily)
VDAAGGQKPLADKIGTTQSQIWYWLERSKKGVPAEFVLRIEGATGVPRHELRPDLYPRPTKPKAEQRTPVRGAGRRRPPRRAGTVLLSEIFD